MLSSQCQFVKSDRLNASSRLKDQKGYTYQKKGPAKKGNRFANRWLFEFIPVGFDPETLLITVLVFVRKMKIIC